MIAPIVPPQGALQDLIHGPARVPASIPTVDKDVLYGMSAVGSGGRVVDKQVFAALRWSSATRLSVRYTESPAGLLLFSSPDGDVALTAEGYFRIPYRLRRRAQLSIGDRVLLIGHRVSKRLLVHTPGQLDNLLAASLRLVAEGAR